MWGVTGLSRHSPFPRFFISTHTPHVGRDFKIPLTVDKIFISTHTPHVGRDLTLKSTKMRLKKFQLTRPMWGVTVNYAGALAPIRPFQLTRPMWGVTCPYQRQYVQ